jgi:alginate O-acetyltransferase complex protein AlgJ
MPWRRFSWADLPVMASGLLLLTGGVLLMVQLAMGALWHGKQMKLCAAVFGVTQPNSTSLTVHNLISGAYQKSLELRIGSREPYYPFAIRMRDQVEYSLFGLSATPDVIIGNHRQLIEIAYIQDYCLRNLQNFMAQAPDWAAAIKTMQDNAQARGQTFLYVITPSKLAQYPEILPPHLNCPSTETDRTQLVPQWAALVRQDGVHIVDTTAVLRAAAQNYPFPFFPRGGAHWNQAGAALATQAIEAALEAQLHDGLLKPFTFTWQLSHHPMKADVDLTILMNLMWTPDHFDTPLVTLHQPSKAPDCKSLKITIVGGSFMEHVGPLLSQLPCGADVVQYFYWRSHRDVWHDGVDVIEPVDPAVRDADLLHADIIIYEENEGVLGRPAHGQAFYQWILAHPVK